MSHEELKSLLEKILEVLDGFDARLDRLEDALIHKEKEGHDETEDAG